MLEIIASLAVSILLLCIVAKLLALPLRLLMKFIVNKLLGFHVTINIFTSLVAGIFGVPGVLIVLAWSYL